MSQQSSQSNQADGKNQVNVQNSSTKTAEGTMSIVGHLAELRHVLMVSVISLAVAAIASYGFLGNQLMLFITSPIRKLGLKLIFTSPFEAFFTQLKVSFFAGFLLVLPIILWQVWRFIVPALKVKELHIFKFFVPIAFILFIGGMAFAYFTVFQVAMKVLLITLPGPGLEPMIKIDEYFSALFSFLLPFGFTFEMPLIVYILAKIGILSHEVMRAKRKYAIFFIFVAAAILTPGPDPLSQILLALPMMLLYEISIWVAKYSKN